MPYIPNQSDEDQQNKAPSQGLVAPNAGGTQLSPTGGVGSGAGASATSKPGAGGNFATLQTYLGANQGQAEPLAGKITSGIGQQYDTLNNQNASTISGINNQVTNAPGYTASNPDVLSQEAANPVSFASDANNVKTFQGLLNNAYSGPTSAEGTSDYQKQQAAINNAIAQGQTSTQTEGGRKQLLTQNEARPTSGVTALNSAILTQDPNSLSKVQDAYKPFNNLLTGLSSGAQGINATIGKETADAASSNKAANDAIAAQSGKLQSDINDKIAGATGDVNKYNAGLQDWQTGVAANQPFNAALGSSNLLKLLNMSNPFEGNYSAMNAPTVNAVATPEQLAIQNALGTLSGKPGSIIDPNAPVGTYQTPGQLPTAPNIAKLMNDIASGTYQKILPAYGPGTLSGLPANATGQQASHFLDIVGQPNGSAPASWAPAYSTYIAPFQALMAQLGKIYGDQYTQPIQYMGKPITGTYELKS